ncbi:protein OCTOPUS-like [Magnolia sinica]|uniref:protein OCTOPUS-like n=1 Tax=Magnolia sinica TaxID=86752 RepID=UPI00265B4BB4|nr:protein OCTOPUS-like [Magnolia sinica]
MNPESSSFTRCVRHPSQFFTGFCSTCLVERLSRVEYAGRSPKPSFDTEQKQVECSLPVSGSEKKTQDIRVRKTLLSLFHLDDNVNEENGTKHQGQIENSTSSVRFAECRNGSANISVGVKFNPVTGVSPDPNLSENNHILENFDSETRFRENGNGSKSDVMGNFNSETQASSSVGVVEDVSVDDGVRKKRSSLEYEKLKEKSVLFCWSSVFSRKVLKWSRSACRRTLTQETNNWNVGFREKQLETKVDFRNSCDQKASYNSNNAFWEDPRHSWDGVMMGKAFTPSFTGIEAVDGKLMGTSGIDWRNSLMSHRRRMSLPEEDISSLDPRPSTDSKDMGKMSTVSLDEEKCMLAGSNLGEPNGDVKYDEPGQDTSVLNTRRKSHGWSKVWNRSLTSPFRDLSKKRENVLERSLSESWCGIQRENNTETIKADSITHLCGGSASSAKKQQIPSGNRNVGNGEFQRVRPDCQKKKKEIMLGRSRSVHYSSPGNLDHGLLRFYLTPLRSSRRTTRKGRMKTSRSFARGIFGF